MRIDGATAAVMSPGPWTARLMASFRAAACCIVLFPVQVEAGLNAGPEGQRRGHPNCHDKRRPRTAQRYPVWCDSAAT